VTEYEVACLGKSRFPTRRSAKKRANQIRRTGGPAMRAYPCHFCHHFHVGHRPGHATYLRRGQPIQEKTNQ
jgi:hypothetical protein